ncbi:MAG: ribonuclease HII [Bacillota bacterium]
MSTLSEYDILFQSERGINLLCGVDEAGRGPLAGPVMVGAIIPDYTNIFDTINDSKKLSDKKRRLLYPQLIESAVAYKTIALDQDIIDDINILEATKLAMRMAISELEKTPDFVLIDAVKLGGLSVPTDGLIHGDAISYAIAAASILAKVERDDIMIKYHEQYPEYGFDVHKGYGTKMHIEMLKKYGPCPIHRRSFIKNFFKD